MTIKMESKFDHRVLAVGGGRRVEPCLEMTTQVDVMDLGVIVDAAGVLRATVREEDVQLCK